MSWWFLHGDGVVGVTGDVPAGASATVGKERVAARQILFGFNGVQLIVYFVVFYGNGQKTDAVDGAVGRTQLGDMETQLVPGEVRKIENRQRAEKREENAARRG